MAEEAPPFCDAVCIPCNICAFLTKGNAAIRCMKCLRWGVDITGGLKKRVIIKHCRECDTYLPRPNTRIRKSEDLTTFCERMLNLKQAGVTLIAALIIWTENKLRCTVKKDVGSGVVLKKSYVVLFFQKESLCESCSRVQTNPDNQWVASVQLRQHVPHRRTFFYLEQLILKHDAAVRATKIKQVDQGIDFVFGDRIHGEKFAEFLGKVAPVRSHYDKQVVGNNYNYKHTFCVEISPICREDFICLPPEVAVSLRNLGPLVICTEVTNIIALLDPFTLRHCYLDGDQYWKSPFKSLFTSKQLVEYIVLGVENISPEVSIGNSTYSLAEAQVARLSDFFGENDTSFFVETHLGHILERGDQVLGYDLCGIELGKYKGLVPPLPQAILIKKCCEEKPLAWNLKSLNMEVDDSRGGNEEKMDMEYEQFLRDLEENAVMRFNVENQPSEIASMTDGENVPSGPLEELFADLDLSKMDHVRKNQLFG